MSKSGVPAFPYVCTEEEHVEEGMSLRDYFACHAPKMDDVWASYRRIDVKPNEEPAQELSLQVQWRYAFADAMLKERIK